jgi:hypothetical protein
VVLSLIEARNIYVHEDLIIILSVAFGDLKNKINNFFDILFLDVAKKLMRKLFSDDQVVRTFLYKLFERFCIN